MNPRIRIAIVAALGLAPAFAGAAELFNNGPIVTNPTGGTGTIAGQPISQADPFTNPNGTTSSTLGAQATFATNALVAEDFDVPAGGWDLDTVTLYAFQTAQTTPTVTRIHINLWTAKPYSEFSPETPLPDPLPQPVLATSLDLDAGPGTFVAHRESTGQTATNRPIFAYTVSLDGLPNSGQLSAGTYWLEWCFVGASSPSSSVFSPLVSPRTSAHNLNVRLFNIPFSGAQRSWFEAREGFVQGQAEGRPYALPFSLGGTPLPEPATGLGLLAALLVVRRR
jgi:hypothetical protein